ncbi:MAG: T9SS type A sorting domain-containing protein [Balneolia bacterium]|nr:T9SS type A sorting domain-containing protein [Balneolia bacterium]
MLLLPVHLYGQQSLHLEVNSPLSDGSSLTPQAQLSFTLQTRALGIDFGLLHSDAVSADSKLDVSLFDNTSVTFEVSRLSSHLNQTQSAITKAVDGRSVYMVSAWQDERYASNIIDYENGRFYTIRYSDEHGVHLLSEISYEQMDVLQCGLDHSAMDKQHEMMHLAGEGRPVPFPQIPTELLDETTATIDVMLVYTPFAAQWAQANEGGIDVSVSLMMAMSQLAMDLSEIDLEFRLVALKEVDYDERDESSLTHIQRLTAGPHLDLGEEFSGYMEEVHEYRDQYGADLVGMLAVISDVGGLAWILNNPQGLPDFGFSFNRIQQLTRTFTLVHEFGHNFGSNHSRLQNSNPAPEAGGLFEYSTGWRWTGDNGTSYASVMAYNEGSIPAPVFSSPDLSWGGGQAGTLNDPTGPADNARSIQEIRHVIAGYRANVTDPPVFSVSDPLITIELLPGEEISWPFFVENSGDGRLNWRLGLDSNEGQYESGDVFQSYNFTAGEGFPQGSHMSLNGWTAIPGNGSYSFEISDKNPSSGQTHLRLPPAEGDWAGIAGPALEGLSSSYEVSFDVYFPENLFFSIYMTAERQSVRMFLRSGSIDLVHSTVDFGVTQQSIQYNHKRDAYRRVNLVVLTNRNEVILRYDDEEIARFVSDNDIIMPERIMFFTQSGTGQFIDAPVDIDNLVLREFDPNMEWIAPIGKQAGSLAGGESEMIELNIQARDLDFGLYRKELVFSSDDFRNPTFTVPVEVIITDTPTSAPDYDQIPDRITLSQNYPNPFNPSTTISFTINEGTDARLDVYTIQGQRVATIADGFYSAGTHSISFDASRLASGMYIYRLRSGAETLSRTMMLLK